MRQDGLFVNVIILDLSQSDQNQFWFTYPVCPSTTRGVEAFFPEFHDMFESGFRPMGRTLNLIRISDPDFALDFEIDGMINIFTTRAEILVNQIFPFFCPNL